ncbi:DDHD domain-containing protein [Dothidotthia symphoricarpi CBS 119687]|uniref:DDHD domain-containing protein n=1 Tax=Dothidotthia symphoricarpi CBS 119687 TaxID=1392245 RepID=A0A6A6AIZ5_9PLEO|nr:DDHD domain-containing protein [Dothidotthia symphoricarpi CBS 119687]KAF2131536.1 DDHD domain-containing protein [Dothidotthia symphoricarpi CBS 119687]
MANREPTMLSHTNSYIREVLHSSEAPPAVPVRYFYTSPLAIDDPLSPLPPPAQTASSGKRQPPRPFSEYDNDAINASWLELRKKILKHNEELGEKGTLTNPAVERLKRKRGGSSASREDVPMKGRDIPLARSNSGGRYSRSAELVASSSPSSSGGRQGPAMGTSLRALDPGLASPSSEPTITGTPFIRAPSRGNLAKAWKPVPMDGGSRPTIHEVDSYKWDDDMEPALSVGKDKGPAKKPSKPKAGPSASVPVGVSRLHQVVMDAESIRMEPIYWSPLSDIARIVRGTWFYKDTMMPVEVEVANMLEAGYIELQPWTQTWKDELNSAAEVGAPGEMKILHKLWPDKVKRPESRPSTSQEMRSTGLVQSTLPDEVDDPEQERRETVEDACDLIDISTGPEGTDNKAAGDLEYGADGTKRLYLKAGIIYADERVAHILKPALQPSDYYGRRPLANYIRKSRAIGVCVVRGFDQAKWDKLHPTKNTVTARRAREGVSTSQAGAPVSRRQKSDAELALSERPKVTDLVLVIHGIGQKLSERMETFHFTHAMNAFRREVNVELGTPSVKRHLRKDMGGVMVLPVNWRHRVSLQSDAADPEDIEDPAVNKYTLKHITPETLPSIRGIVSDVMLDVPYYLSPEHNPKMIAACIQEANRIYRTWCANNPGFQEYGRVHLIAHSLGSVMAVDILSQQPTYVDPELSSLSYPEEDLPTDQFVFDTTDLFVCGSPVGLFLLMKNAGLLPRRDKEKPGADSYAAPGVAGEQGTYGCLAVDNIYNIINPYDPVACRINATVDVVYAEMLKPVTIPSASSSYFAFSNPFRRQDSSSAYDVNKPPTFRLPSNVELETHNFTREEIAEKRAYLLNDNGQIDFFMKYGGGPLEIQYLTMLGAHSSYWLSRDFVRMIVVEVGRGLGKEGTVPAMRAVKKKPVVGM